MSDSRLLVFVVLIHYSRQLGFYNSQCFILPFSIIFFRWQLFIKPLEICIHPFTGGKAVKTLTKVLLNTFSAFWITSVPALKNMMEDWSKIIHLISRQLPRNTHAFFQKSPCPAILELLNLTFPVLQRHLEKVFLCAHSFD